MVGSSSSRRRRDFSMEKAEFAEGARSTKLRTRALTLCPTNSVLRELSELHVRVFAAPESHPKSLS
jgi:hypothetical protein